MQSAVPSPSESLSDTPHPQAPVAIFAGFEGQSSLQSGIPSLSVSVSAALHPQAPGAIFRRSSGSRHCSPQFHPHPYRYPLVPHPQMPGSAFEGSAEQPSLQSGVPSPSESVSGTPQPQMPGTTFGSAGEICGATVRRRWTGSTDSCQSSHKPNRHHNQYPVHRSRIFPVRSLPDHRGIRRRSREYRQSLYRYLRLRSHRGRFDFSRIQTTGIQAVCSFILIRIGICSTTRRYRFSLRRICRTAVVAVRNTVTVGIGIRNPAPAHPGMIYPDHGAAVIAVRRTVTVGIGICCTASAGSRCNLQEIDRDSRHCSPQFHPHPYRYLQLPQPQIPGSAFEGSAEQPSLQSGIPSPSVSVSGTPQPQMPGTTFGSAGQRSAGQPSGVVGPDLTDSCQSSHKPNRHHNQYPVPRSRIFPVRSLPDHRGIRRRSREYRQSLYRYLRLRSHRGRVRL